MSPGTLFDGSRIVLDAMIIINFHGLLMLDKIVSWSPREIVIEKRVRKEAQYSTNGVIDLAPYIEKGLVIEEEIEGKEQEDLFYYYKNRQVGKARIHEPDAACLALAISKGYGLASNERVILEEFRSRYPGKPCFSAWDIVTKAQRLGFISEKEAGDLKVGICYL